MIPQEAGGTRRLVPPYRTGDVATEVAVRVDDVFAYYDSPFSETSRAKSHLLSPLYEYDFHVADRRVKHPSWNNFEGDFLFDDVIADGGGSKYYERYSAALRGGDIGLPLGADSHGVNCDGQAWGELGGIMRNYIALGYRDGGSVYYESVDGGRYLSPARIPDPDVSTFSERSRYLPRFVYEMKDFTDGLVINNPCGIMPIASEEGTSSGLSSRFIDLLTERTRMQFGKRWTSTENRIEPCDLHKLMEFFEDAQFLAVRGENEEDQFYTGVALVESDVGEEPGYCTNTYQICIADGNEGGIQCAEPTLRAAEVQAYPIDVSLVFNDEEVIGYSLVYPSSGTITQEEPGEAYSVTLDRYGCVVARFTTRKKVIWR